MSRLIFETLANVTLQRDFCRRNIINAKRDCYSRSQIQTDNDSDAFRRSACKRLSCRA